MQTKTTSSDRINQLKAEIVELEKSAIAELFERRNTLSHQLAQVDTEIAQLTGKPLEAKIGRKSAERPSGKSPSLQELKELLENAPNKTISCRKEGYDLRNIKVLANANPHLLAIGGNGAWPTVTLLK